jgi:adenosylcobinamide-phosphate synthase
MSVALALFAMLIELCLGYPQPLMRAIGHPVTWAGSLIGTLDRALNHACGNGLRRAAGLFAVLVVLGIIGSVAFLIQHELLRLPFGILATAILASPLIAQRSLHLHVANVAAALETQDLSAGRTAVSHIVGRDTATLDQAGVARAAIESLAENFSDAIVAPVLWLAIAGLPGGALYKTINTADSMIGHRTQRYAAFGWAAARLDDLVNLPASRLAALLVIAATALHRDASAAEAWRAMWRDASRHRSPNAGYPEAAMAGALGLSLAGPRVYDGVSVDDAMMGDGRRDAGAADIRRALALYRTADAILIALLAVAAAIFIAPETFILPN